MKRPRKEKVAIIGAGMAGLGCAYFLHKDYELTIFEKNDYAGGHSHTFMMDEGDRQVPIDTAVMIFNQGNYPNFWRLLQKLEVPTGRITSTISFQYLPSGLEYAVPNINQVFARRRNALKPSFWRLMKEILRFGYNATEVLAENSPYAGMSVAEYAKARKYSDAFLHQYLLPTAAALWSADPEAITRFSIVTLVRYFDNHHMLRPTIYSNKDRATYAWHGFTGGTQVYRQKLLDMFPDAMRYNSPIAKVKRTKNKVTITTAAGKTAEFDRVIFACHADEALAMLADPSPLEKQLLSAFKFRTNTVTLHTDSSVMPKRRRAWASFNCRVSSTEHGLHSQQNYYLNILQNLPTDKDYFLAIGNHEGIDPKHIIKEFTYSHVMYSVETAKAQKRLNELNQNGQTYFCGSYFRYSFHEDAFWSAIQVCREITGEVLWNDGEDKN